MDEPGSTAAMERQRVLDGLNVLDEPPLAVFEHIVQVASAMSDTPIALVSLVDRKRLYFMARVGFDDVEAPYDGSLCQFAMAQPGRMMEIEDASQDPRFANSLLVKGMPGIRFYAGVPLVLAGNCAIGTLCIIDRRPRVLTESQRVALDSLAQVTVELLEARQRDMLRKLPH